MKVGLTGGIACGKSYVLRGLAAAGLATVDLDPVAHDVMAPGGPAYDDVVRAFGPEVLAPDGRVDRRRLGERVFADEEARARLNAIVHPRVREEEGRRVAAVGGERDAVVVDAALLVEAGVHLRFRRLVVVHCPPDFQVRRLRERDGLDEAAARARLAAQMPIDEKRRFAHVEVDTSGTFAETDRQVTVLAETLRALSRSAPGPAPVPLQRAAACLVWGPAEGPRGLSPAGVLSDIVAAGGPEMDRLARRLVPPARPPWYRPAGEPPGPGPETLAAPVVLWSLARAGADEDHVVAAAASLARLTHAEPSALAAACLQALLLQAAAVAGDLGPARKRLYDFVAVATRWGGARPGPRVREALRVAQRHPHDAARARETAGDAETGALAAALVAIAGGSPASAVPPDLLSTLQALNALGPG